MKEKAAVFEAIGMQGNSWYFWRPMLLGPVSMLFVYGCYGADRLDLCQKKYHEAMALWILSAAICLFAAGAIRYRKRFYQIMTVMTMALFCREVHFAGTSTGIYIALAGIAGWMFVQRIAFCETLKQGAVGRWWLATMAVYFLSVVVSRRAFRHVLPYEKELHIQLEEVMETTAHLMLLVTSILAWRWGQYLRRNSTKTESSVV